MNEIKAYSCEHCNKYYKKTKKSVENHEEICFANPINRACQSCQHNERVSRTVYNPFHGGNPGSTDYDTQINWCNKLDIELDRYALRKDCLSWEPKIDIEELIEHQNKQKLS
jgi:hypothetical protein